MTDIFTKAKRSKIMSSISSKNTKPEVILRKALFGKGYRYRINYAKLPGKPDIVLPQYKTVIFVNGCFWHAHIQCKDAHLPKTNIEFWKNKINLNVERDNKNIKQLKELGWNIIIVWECEIKKKNMPFLLDKITNCLSQAKQQKSFALKIYDYIDGEVSKVAEEIIPYKKNANSRK